MCGFWKIEESMVENIFEANLKFCRTSSALQRNYLLGRCNNHLYGHVFVEVGAAFVCEGGWLVVGCGVRVGWLASWRCVVCGWLVAAWLTSQI